MYQIAGGRVTGAIGNAPTHYLGWTGDDLGPAFVELGGELGGEEAVLAVAAAFDNANEAVPKITFYGRGELDRKNHIRTKGIVEHRPEALPNTWGVDDNAHGLPRLREGA